MATSPLAGKPAPPEMLVDLGRLEREYYERRPDLDDPDQLVSFGTSGHRGSSLRRHRSPRRTSSRSPRRSASTGAAQGIDGPLYMGKDTHALSGAGPADRARGAGRQRRRDASSSATTASRRRRSSRTPSSSTTAARGEHLADGIVITPSHNPPEDGGFKYNPPNGGPADTDVTRWIQDRANELLRDGNAGVKRVPVRSAPSRRRPRSRHDFVLPYVDDLRNVDRHGRDPRGRPEARRRPARRRGRRATGSRSTPSTASTSTVVNPAIDPTLRVHDRRPRRQDPHGLLEPVRDGGAGRRSRTGSASPSATTPTPTATASSRRRRG